MKNKFLLFFYKLKRYIKKYNITKERKKFFSKLINNSTLIEKKIQDVKINGKPLDELSQVNALKRLNNQIIDNPLVKLLLTDGLIIEIHVINYIENFIAIADLHSGETNIFIKKDEIYHIIHKALYKKYKRHPSFKQIFHIIRF